MQPLINIIENLKKSEIKKIIDSRMKEFSELGKKNINEIFKELCFCLLTANFSAQGGIKIQNAVDNGFLTLSETDLAKKLSELGHRFPNARARYIFEARQKINDLRKILENEEDEIKKREEIVKNIKGLGMKESSHFLRNIGYKNLAIIDFHIVDLLVKNNLIIKPNSKSLTPKKYIKPNSKSLTPKKYIEIENLLREIAEKTNLNLGELDLYLWYEETGKILK
ncbi:N-glycosylase/DNA lyase [Candidatus Pacearchaeota archaeon]|nr:N-glycosylase/DNA lyase [Candidatus Pacearchaeota archaeon]